MIDENGDEFLLINSPIMIDTQYYYVFVYDKHMKIGCEIHLIEDWFNFNNKTILEMDGKRALSFWKKWKEPLRQICNTRITEKI